MIDKDSIKSLAGRYDRVQETIDEHKEDQKAIMGAVKAAQIEPAAFKSALKLQKLKPTKLKAWLDSFDACRDALGLDAQMDLEDTIRALDESETETEVHFPGQGPLKFGGKHRKARRQSYDA